MHLAEDAVLLVRARIDKREDVPRLIALDVSVPDVSEGPRGPVTITLPANRCTPPVVERLKEVLASHPGTTEVQLQLTSAGRSTVLRLDDRLRVTAGTGRHGGPRRSCSARAACRARSLRRQAVRRPGLRVDRRAGRANGRPGGVNGGTAYEVVGSRRAIAARRSRPTGASISTSRPARSSGCSARTAPARPRSCASWSGWSGRTPARCRCSGTTSSPTRRSPPGWSPTSPRTSRRSPSCRCVGRSRPPHGCAASDAPRRAGRRPV